MTTNKTLRLDQASAMVGGQLRGNRNCGEISISGFASLETAGPSDMTFLARAKDKHLLTACRAACALAPPGLGDAPMPVIELADPYLGAAIIHSYLLARPFVAQGIHATTIIGADCLIPEEVSIGAHVVIGDRARLGTRTRIDAGVVLGDDVILGDDCWLKANVAIADATRIGHRVVIDSGTVIGSDGYGYATDRATGQHYKRPQVGIVRIENDVEIGACCCIDRATFGETVIGHGTKIDNLVQIAHNVVVGANALLVAQVGIAGSAILGRNVVIAGASKLKGHIHIGDRVTVAGASGVHNNVPSGATVAGVPAINARQWLKSSAIYQRLPEMYDELKKLRGEVQSLLPAAAATSEDEHHDK
ncbi:MAG: UDP-3-O-(3-hydroxymyristoyl)glucosamine N-acyltransferase [Desulfobulbaceae bacterium]|jgi:UDP-3-O-[3-hydroxymyristoyl] glucosamine N-acyltransferase|nr:UDP-3-O-(3-hydroxymyristoyl)glucosamine N-acyltransferase [Desulfobulbaceae bacterium]